MRIYSLILTEVVVVDDHIYIPKEFTLTPRTEAKYNKIDEEFHLMMQRNQVNGARVVMMMILI